MAFELRRATSLLLVLLFFCPSSSTNTVMEVHIHGYKNSSFMQDIYTSEWGLESENGRRLLQAKQYIDYGTLKKDMAAPGASKPGNAYTRGCQANFYCK